jgi:hypothetical protein
MRRLSLQRVIAGGLVAAASLGGTARAAIPPHVTGVSPKDGATGVPVDGVVTVVGSGTWTEGNWVKVVLIEDATGKEIPLKHASAQWGKHYPDPHQPPGWVGGGTYTDTILTYTPVERLKPRTRYLVRVWSALRAEEKPLEVRFTSAAGATKPASPSPGTKLER